MLWFEKGDIVDSILHPECKERKGNELKSGEKSISIKREWLEKAAEECKFEDKTMCLPFIKAVNPFGTKSKNPLGSFIYFSFISENKEIICFVSKISEQ